VLFLVFILSSCVEEPTVSPVIRPYSSIRVGNFSNNVASINIEIDGEINYSIPQHQLTEHFDVTSGQRMFIVTNDGGDTLFNSKVTATSYEEITLLFTGYSAPGPTPEDKFNNTFVDFPYSEGIVYILNGPDNADTAWVHYIDVIADTPTDTSRSFLARCIDMDDAEADPVDADDELGFNTVQSVALTPGNKKFLFLFQTNESDVNPTYDTLGNFNMNLEGGVRHYLFLTGTTEVEGIVPVHKVQVPLPVRSK
jgi:hypothetical protein